MLISTVDSRCLKQTDPSCTELSTSHARGSKALILLVIQAPKRCKRIVCMGFINLSTKNVVLIYSNKIKYINFIFIRTDRYVCLSPTYCGTHVDLSSTTPLFDQANGVWHLSEKYCAPASSGCKRKGGKKETCAEPPCLRPLTPVYKKGGNGIPPVIHS